MNIRITLNRPSDEAAREYWLAQLAFSKYDWMKAVRVWDADKRWLWPNLSYLLRLPGRQRVERYGGVDPVKGVDNDFAAVLIRKYDANGAAESEGTQSAPLVSAEWYPVGVTNADRFTVAHAAQSDEFAIQLGGPGKARQGMVAVWLIYADFMGARLPAAWPKTPEWAGGILAFFEIQWELKPHGAISVSLRQAVPKKNTGFDWQEWAELSPTPTLSDRATDNDRGR